MIIGDIRELYKIADSYYKEISAYPIFKRNKALFFVFVLFVFLLLLSIFLILKHPFEPITWKKLLFSLKGILFVVSLTGLLILWVYIDRKVYKNFEEKQKILCGIFNCKPTELRKIFELYNNAYEEYLKHNKEFFINFGDFVIKILKFLSWIFASLFLVLIKKQINNPKLMFRLILTVVLMYITWGQFYFIIPQMIKDIGKFLWASKEMKVKILFADLSYVAPIIKEKSSNN